MKDCTNSDKMKQLLTKLLLTKSEQYTKMIAIKVDVYLKNNLLLGLIIGLLCVSAGAFLYINKINIRPIITFK